jgi:DGQHR domain-containing protein
MMASASSAAMGRQSGVGRPGKGGRVAKKNDSEANVQPDPVRQISVIVPVNPFVTDPLREKKHCLCALDVEKLMEWWPGMPHVPHRNAQKVKNIQRSLDWKRVAEIAGYLLQEEIIGAAEKIDQFFSKIYQPTRNEPGRQWPPRVPKVVGYRRSGYPTFSNVLIHVNGAKIQPLPGVQKEAAKLEFNEDSPDLNFSVIDGQHRINGAYLAVKMLQSRGKVVKWEIPAEIFLDLDPSAGPPRHQAQIFIDVNFYQKKVDKSLVADLFPTARGSSTPLDDQERVQDLGRRLMLDVGPLVGLVQIPGIKYGAKDVVTLATLNSAIEDVLEPMHSSKIRGLEAQSEFLALCLEAWLHATGRFEDPLSVRRSGLSSENVAYQGRVIVSVLTLIPALLVEMRDNEIHYASEKATKHLIKWLHDLAERAGILKEGKLLPKDEFKDRQYLGAGGLARFRDVLWAAASSATSTRNFSDERISDVAQKHREKTARRIRAPAE